MDDISELAQLFKKSVRGAELDLQEIYDFFEGAEEALKNDNIELAEEILVEYVSDHMFSLESFVGSMHYRLLDQIIEIVDKQLEKKYPEE